MSYEDEFDELDGDEVGVYPGTIRRPGGARWDPTIRWGDRVEITADFSNSGVSYDLLNVQLPKASTCQLIFSANVLSPTETAIYWTEIELLVGNGSATSRFVKRYQWLPNRSANGAVNNVEDIWTLPLANVRGRVRCGGDAGVIECTLGMCPLARYL